MSTDPPGVPSWPRTTDRESNGWNTSPADDADSSGPEEADAPLTWPPLPEADAPLTWPPQPDVSTTDAPVSESSEGTPSAPSEPTTEGPPEPVAAVDADSSGPEEVDAPLTWSPLPEADAPLTWPPQPDVSTTDAPVSESSEGTAVAQGESTAVAQDEPTSVAPSEPTTEGPPEPVAAVDPLPTEDAVTADTEPVPAAPVVPARRRTRTAAPPRRRRKARRVHRVVHHFDTWSVARVSFAFGVCGYFVTLITGVLLWQMARRVGTIEGIEGFMEDTGGYDTFILDGTVVFQVAAFVGVLLAILFVCLAVLGSVLFNLITDLTGGVRMTVIDEDLIVTPARRPQPAEPEAPPGPERG